MTHGAQTYTGGSCRRRSEKSSSRLSVPASKTDANPFRALVQIPPRTLGGRKAVGAKEKAPVAPELSIHRPKRVDGEETTS